MKILQLGKFYPIRGGVEKVMWDLTRGISARGIDCDMLCAWISGDDIDKADRIYARAYDAESAGVKLPTAHGLKFNEHGRVFLARSCAKVAATMISPEMVRVLRRICRDYDVIHVHHPDPMACLALWLSGYRGKVVLHWHSDILKQKGLLRLYMPLQRWLVLRADKIVGTTPVYVAQSPFLQEVQEKVTYLPIGSEGIDVDSEHSEESSSSEGPRPHIIYSLGRLVEYKGYKYLVEAAKYLPEGYEVVIGGSGPLRDELQAQIDSLGLQHRVRLLRRVADEDLAKRYGACDVFVLSSVMKTEAFGIVQIEAMSCGKPVVATKIPGSGTAWVNEDGVSGINVDICDARAIADAVLAIEADYERYSRGARDRFERVFTFAGMIDNCLSIYEGL